MGEYGQGGLVWIDENAVGQAGDKSNKEGIMFSLGLGKSTTHLQQ